MNLFRKLIFCFCVALILITLQGCAIFRTYEISKNYDKPRYKRVGLLVCRMGNKTFTGVSIITLKTNYAIRMPKPQSTMGLTDNFVDVYIDDVVRLQKSLPDYPKYMPASFSNIGSLRREEETYFKNISPQVYNSVAELLKEKKYEVVNIREVSRGWENPFSEMTVDEILTKLRGSVDALIIFHYMDVGNFHLYAITTERTSTGFSFLSYTISMFDVATKERLIFFKPLFPCNVSSALMNDPETKDKFKVSGSTQMGVLTGAEEEVIKRALGYVCYGTKYHDSATGTGEEWKGLNSIVP